MIKWRAVQQGEGPIVFGFLIGNHMDAELRAALPGRPIVMSSESGLQVTRGDLVAGAVQVGAKLEAHPPVLVGFSAGCQGVRKLLAEGLEVSGVIVLDGTHSSIPISPAHTLLWGEHMDRAREGREFFDGSCTQMGYVERIPVGQPGRASSTRHVLEAAAGVDLPPGTVIAEGNLHLESHPSADVDKDAHIREQREHLPRVLRERLAPFLAAREGSPALPPPPAEPAPPTGSGAPSWAEGLDLDELPLGLRIAAWLGAQLALDWREVAGAAKHNPLIVKLGEICRRGGRFLGVDLHGLPLWSGTPGKVAAATDEEAWCAKLRSAALLASLRPGETPPHGLRVAVWELCEDAAAAKRLHLVSSGYQPKAGDAAILKRAGGNPLAKGSGHVRTIIAWDGPNYLGIGGNEGNDLGHGWHPFADPDLVAWIEA